MTSDTRYEPRQGAGASDPAGKSAPATGSADLAETELTAEEEPVTTGTLFLTLIILMIIGAFWVVVYLRLIGR